MIYYYYPLTLKESLCILGISIIWVIFKNFAEK